MGRSSYLIIELLGYDAAILYLEQADLFHVHPGPVDKGNIPRQCNGEEVAGDNRFAAGLMVHFLDRRSIPGAFCFYRFFSLRQDGNAALRDMFGLPAYGVVGVEFVENLFPFALVGQEGVAAGDFLCCHFVFVFAKMGGGGDSLMSGGLAAGL